MTTATLEKRNFLGIPITGVKPESYRSRTKQKSAEELEPFLQAIGDIDDDFEAIRWTQYTPYFNDGDPCVFSVGEAQVRYASFNEDEDGDYWPGFYSPDDEHVQGGPEMEYFNYVKTPEELDAESKDWEARTGKAPDRWSIRTSEWKDKPTGVVFPKKPSADAVKAFCDAINSGAFNDVLEQAFGDHVDVRLTRVGFEVDTYEHD